MSLLVESFPSPVDGSFSDSVDRECWSDGSGFCVKLLEMCSSPLVGSVYGINCCSMLPMEVELEVLWIACVDSLSVVGVRLLEISVVGG